MIEGDARVSLNIHRIHDLDSRVAFKAVVVAAQPLFQIALLGHTEDHHVAFTLQLLHRQLRAHQTRFVIVGSYEGQPLARGRVGIHGDHRDVLANRGVDIRLHHRRIRNGNHDARRLDLLGQHPLEGIVLRLGIERVRSHHLRLHAHLLGRAQQSRIGALPVGDLDVGRHQPIFLGRFVRG